MRANFMKIKFHIKFILIFQNYCLKKISFGFKNLVAMNKKKNGQKIREWRKTLKYNGWRWDGKFYCLCMRMSAVYFNPWCLHSNHSFRVYRGISIARQVIVPKSQTPLITDVNKISEIWKKTYLCCMEVQRMEEITIVENPFQMSLVWAK